MVGVLAVVVVWVLVCMRLECWLELGFVLRLGIVCEWIAVR